MPKPSVCLAPAPVKRQGAVVCLVPCETAFSRPPSHPKWKAREKRGFWIALSAKLCTARVTTAPAGPPWRWRTGRARSRRPQSCCPYRALQYQPTLLVCYQNIRLDWYESRNGAGAEGWGGENHACASLG